MRWLTVCFVLVAAAAQAVAGAPDVGDPAPPFELRGSDGKVYELSRFVGRTPVVIAWFPKAFTGG